VLADDMTPLSAPFTGDEQEVGNRYAVLARWGWVLDDLGTLEHELRDNLDQRYLGFAAWRDQAIGEQRRILISDHLLDAVGDVSTNLVEAKVHLSSFREISHEEASKVRWRPDLGGGFAPIMGRSPEETVRSAERGMHLAGLLRAVGSTLDCLGGAVIGLGALPVDLKKRADWNSARNALRKADKRTRELLDLDALVESAGPPGWSDWTLAMRNLYVHRPRPMQMSYVRPIYKASTGPRIVNYLPRTPADSFVESFVRSGSYAQTLLPEDATTTMTHVTTSVVEVAAALSTRLLQLWRDRLAGDWLEQPAMQWGRPSATPGFDGYVKDEPFPRERGIGLMLNPVGVLRINAAALNDKARRRTWRNWPKSLE
jgi:hypothetical protein